jgi:hypothetical protein
MLLLLIPNVLIQETVSVNSTAVVRSVKVLAVHMSPPSIDDVIGLMKCFPCLQKLYVKVGNECFPPATIFFILVPNCSVPFLSSCWICLHVES